MNRPTLLTLPILGGALALAACTTPREHAMAGGHQHGSADHHSRMCAMHRQAMAGKSPAEQQAAIEAHVKSMHGSADPQHVAMHRQMMDKHCGGMSAAPAAK